MPYPRWLRPEHNMWQRQQHQNQHHNHLPTQNEQHHRLCKSHGAPRQQHRSATTPVPQAQTLTSTCRDLLRRRVAILRTRQISL